MCCLPPPFAPELFFPFFASRWDWTHCDTALHVQQMFFCSSSILVQIQTLMPISYHTMSLGRWGLLDLSTRKTWTPRSTSPQPSRCILCTNLSALLRLCSPHVKPCTIDYRIYLGRSPLFRRCIGSISSVSNFRPVGHSMRKCAMQFRSIMHSNTINS